MSLRGIVSAVGCALMFLGVVYGFQKPWREYPAVEYNNFPLPPDSQVPAEWTFARLMFPGGGPEADGYYPRFQGDYRHGLSLWTQDYPRADRHLARAMRRLTRIDVRSVEQVVALDDDDDAFNFPWIYAVQVGEWGLTQKEAAKLREYIQRGGFFMADDLHGNSEWRVFAERIHYAFPDREIVELPDDDPYFHVVFDITDRPQVPGEAHLREGCKNCSDGGRGAHWRAIKDDKGRIVVAISHNSDLGDGWEFADAPYYPEKQSSLAIQIAVNDVVYAMTH
ncbi:MAG: DUF4159 domain-containing protein [Acidobacteriota bacterium]